MGNKNIEEENSGEVSEANDDRPTGSLLSKVIPEFIRRRYAVKFTLAITLIILVVGSAGAVTYVDARNLAQDNAEDQLQSTVQLQANSLSRWIGELRTQTQTISAHESLADGDRSAVRERLTVAKNRSSDRVAAIYLVDARNSTVVASTKEPVDGESLSDIEMPWADPSVADSLNEKDDVWTSQAYLSTAHHNHELLAFASPVAGDEDRYLVVVGKFYHSVQNLYQPATNQTTWVVNADGDTVLAGNVTDLSSPEDNAGHVQRILEEDHGTQDQGTGKTVEVHEHGDSILAYTPIEGTDWVAVTSVEKSAAYALGTAVGRNVLYLIGASLLSLLVVGIVLGRWTVRPLADLRERSQRMEQGELDVPLETRRTDEFGRLYEAFASMRDSLRKQIETTEQLTRHVERKADEYHAVMKDCAEGDLTRRMDPESRNEAMTSIAEAFNSMMDDIEETTANLKQFADEVATASEVVTTSSEEVYSASKQVTKSIQKISNGADDQNRQLQSIAAEMSGLSATTEQISASSKEVAELSEKTARAGNTGREAAREAMDGLEKIETTSDEAVAEIEKLQTEMAEIDELVDLITNIATETNMLALNASIEVSRSSAEGGNDDGFAAVANKIKELADEARVAAEDIEDRLEQITEQTERTAEEVQSARNQVSEQAESIERAIGALEQIADYAQETNAGVQKISDTTDQQADSTEEVVSMIDEVAAISDTTTAEAESVAAAAEEQTTALTEVSQSASDLTNHAERLSEELNRFETDAAAGGSLVDDDAHSGTTEETIALPDTEYGPELTPGDGETGDEPTPEQPDSG